MKVVRVRIAEGHSCCLAGLKVVDAGIKVSTRTVSSDFPVIMNFRNSRSISLTSAMWSCLTTERDNG